MNNKYDLYEFVFALIPRLELSRDKNSILIEELTNFINNSNRINFGDGSKGTANLGKFGKIRFPFYSFGKVKSYFHLEYRELVIFALYRSLMNEKINFLDIGGNLGLHSIIISKLPHKKILFFEPDKEHFKAAHNRFRLNRITSKVKTYNIAISNFTGVGEFIRVMDNTTSSHLKNESRSAYGPLNFTKVQVNKLTDFLTINEKYLAKIDVEGAEGDLLDNLNADFWENFDCIVEITNEINAKKIYKLAYKNKLNIYSQKISWNKVKRISDLPFRWDEGSVFISKKTTREKLFRYTY